MRIEKEPIQKIGQQEELNLESSGETRQSLIESIRRKHRNNEPLNEEELDFQRREISELDDNPYQSRGANH